MLYRPSFMASSVMRPGFSPDADALVGSKIQLLSRFHVERGIPGINVAHRGRAVLSGGMGVGHDLLAKGRFARLLPPVLPVGNEELLIAGEARLGWRRLARRLISIVCGGDTGYIRDVLGQRLLAVDG